MKAAGISSTTPSDSAEAWFWTGTSDVTSDEAIDTEVLWSVQTCTGQSKILLLSRHTELASDSSYKEGTYVALDSVVSVLHYLLVWYRLATRRMTRVVEETVPFCL